MRIGKKKPSIEQRAKQQSPFETKYQILKKHIIADMRERSGTYNINYTEACDMAASLAQSLPEGVVLADQPSTSKLQQPLLKTTIVCAIVFFFFAVYHVLTTQL